MNQELMCSVYFHPGVLVHEVAKLRTNMTFPSERHAHIIIFPILWVTHMKAWLQMFIIIMANTSKDSFEYDHTTITW